MPAPVATAVVEHLREEQIHGGYEAAERRAELVDDAYAAIGRVIGADARNIAIVENATVGFSQAVSAFEFERGDVILTTRNDYISNQLTYLSLQRRFGIEVERADDAAQGGVDAESMRARLERRRPSLVAITWVPTNSGLVQPMHEVTRLCREHDVPVLIDACQAVGQIPIDVATLDCDFLSATARKFLRGPRGVGFLYVADRMLERGAHPLFLDMRGAAWTAADAFELYDGARRFENWEFAYALLLGLGEASRYALAAGIERCGRRAAELAAYARERLGDVAGIRVLDRGPELCAIVSAAIDGRDAGDVVTELRDMGINTCATGRDSAVIDMDEKRAPTAVRISPHYYNTREEIGVLVSALEGCIG